jgi:hypothetical protein
MRTDLTARPVISETADRNTAVERVLNNLHRAARPVHDPTDPIQAEAWRLFTWGRARADRALIAAVSRWARACPPGSCWPRFERSFWPGWYVSRDRSVEVCWRGTSAGTHEDGDLVVTMREYRYGPAVQVTLPDEALTVRRAVDLLVTLGVLPAEFSSAYAAGRESRVGAA